MAYWDCGGGQGWINNMAYWDCGTRVDKQHGLLGLGGGQGWINNMAYWDCGGDKGG